jgi:dienelactone hydrolase
MHRLSRRMVFSVVFTLFLFAAFGLGVDLAAVRAQDSSHESKASDRFTGPWNVAALKKVPAATWGEKSGLIQEVYYEGEPMNGKPTRVFAYVARPESHDKPAPGMVLVHGGGGTAFPEWATLWARRGYMAIAMDLAGCGPKQQRLPDGGPDQDDGTKFRNFSDAEANQMWTYHAVAAVMRGHSLLASCEGIDPNRIGITGISWGGYLTCIVAGVDDRLKAAVPVYGCGFLHENSYHGWMEILAKMSPEQRNRWVSLFDPSRYLPGVRCPILFVNGTNDFAYPMDSYQKCYRLVPGPVALRIQVNMPHGHGVGWEPSEIGLFTDSFFTGGDPLTKLGPLTTSGDRAATTFEAKVPVVKAELNCTSDTGPWHQRKWTTTEAKISGNNVQAELPKQRPLVYFLNVTDQRGAMVSTEHAVLP